MLTIDFSLLGYNVACFTAVKADGERTELGLAWVNLAPHLWIAAARTGREATGIKIEYHAGSWKSGEHTFYFQLKNKPFTRCRHRVVFNEC